MSCRDTLYLNLIQRPIGAEKYSLELALLLKIHNVMPLPISIDFRYKELMMW